MSIATPARSAIAAEERDRGERGVNEHHEVENGSDPSIFGPKPVVTRGKNRDGEPKPWCKVQQLPLVRLRNEGGA